MIADINSYFGFYPIKKLDVSFQRLVEIKNKHSIDRIFTLSLRGIFYNFQEGNQETLLKVKEDRTFQPVATIDLRMYFGEEDYFRKIEKKFQILRLFPATQGWPIEYSPFYRLLPWIEELNMVLMVEIGRGRGGDITKLSRLTSKFTFPVILTGIGYWNFAETLSCMKDNPRIYVETSQFNTPDAYEVFCKEVGEGRIIFGSGIPLQSFLSVWLPFERSKLSRIEKEKIAGKNISRLLNL